MVRTKGKLGICVGFLVLILAFIWGNSAMPGQTSAQFSGWVGEFLKKLLPFLSADPDQGIHVLRKLAHFSEFAVLGVCLGWLFGMYGKGIHWPVLCGVAAAGIDESIQLFSPGRYASIMDVGIDSLGVLTGVSMLMLLHALWRKYRDMRADTK